jgi:hypothetical protein
MGPVARIKFLTVEKIFLREYNLFMDFLDLKTVVAILPYPVGILSIYLIEKFVRSSNPDYRIPDKIINIMVYIMISSSIIGYLIVKGNEPAPEPLNRQVYACTTNRSGSNCYLVDAQYDMDTDIPDSVYEKTGPVIMWEKITFSNGGYVTLESCEKEYKNSEIYTCYDENNEVWSIEPVGR